MNKFREIFKADMSGERPSRELTEETINAMMSARYKEPRKLSRRFANAIVIIIVLFIFAATTVAASLYFLFLKPSEVADIMGDKVLSASFEGDNVININESITSDGFTFTLLAIMSGKDLEDKVLFGNSDKASDERTYAVVAIQNEDKSKLVDEDGCIRMTEFYISPMVKGLKPWLVNIGSMHGNAFADVVDGIMYYIAECDTVEPFADRGLYLVVCKGGPIYDIDAIIYDDETGVISANPEYDGPCAVFDLPIDKALADPEKAEEYLNSIYYYPAVTEPEDHYLPEIERPENGPATHEEWMKWRPEDKAAFYNNIDWDKAVLVPSTLEELSVGKDGTIAYLGFIDYYYWGGPPISVVYEDIKGVQSKIVEIRLRWNDEGTDYTIQGIRISIDEEGLITGVVIEIPSENEESRKDAVNIPSTIAEYNALSSEEQMKFRKSIDWNKGVTVEGSLKEATVGTDGRLIYSWKTYNEDGTVADGGSLESPYNLLFIDNGTAQSRMLGVFSMKETDDGKLQVRSLRASIDENGKITVVTLDMTYPFALR